MSEETAASAYRPVTQGTADHAAPRAIVAQDLVAFNSRDAEAEVRLFTADADLASPGGGGRGAEAVARFAHAWWEAFPDARVRVEHETAWGPTVVIEGFFTGTHVGTLRMPDATLPASGRRVENAFVAVYEVRDGLIVSRRLYFDRLRFAAEADHERST